MTLHKFLFPAALAVGFNSMQAGDLRGLVRDTSEPLIGASVYWAGTNVGTVTDLNGAFKLHRIKGYNQLVVAYVGYKTDTLSITQTDSLTITLKPESTTLNAVVVHGHQKGNYIDAHSTLKTEHITFTGLTKLACCTVAESFENSASVSVGYSDAVSGTRQIKMLGLAGTYTQLLDESRPTMQGIGAPYGLTYTPGVWLKSIQISKGISSVTAGHDAITGQINLEHRQPNGEEKLFINGYLDDLLHPELNIVGNIPLKKDKSLSTNILINASGDTNWREMGAMDRNHDGFRDLPDTRLLNLANRWVYIAPTGLQLHWGWRVLQDNRTGGQMQFHDTEANRNAMATAWGDPTTLYGSHIANKAASAYFKIGMPVGQGYYDEVMKMEKRSSVAFTANYEYFRERAYFGLNRYSGTENTLNATLMYNHYFNYNSWLAVGTQARLYHLNETLDNHTPWYGDGRNYTPKRHENEVGAYAEYTWERPDRFTLVAGLRGDYNEYFHRTMFTPRMHLKWTPTKTTALRASAGLGFRTANYFTDNMGIMATGRKIVFAPNTEGDYTLTDRIEKTLTFGASLTQRFSLGGDNNASLSIDYFRTHFYHSVIADAEYDPSLIYIYSLNGGGNTDTYQVDLSYSPSNRLELNATFRYNYSHMTLMRPNGSTLDVERPLISRFKGLINAQYATKWRVWVFDLTAQLNGKARIPSLTAQPDQSKYSPVYPMLFAQVTRRIKTWDLYAGVENILDYRQKDPILSADAPFSPGFNSMNVWGPLMGRKFYIGFRLNIY